MTEPDTRPFVWTFPVYVLATNYTLGDNDSFTFNENTRFMAPKMADGVPHLAVFTDRDNAERYRERCDKNPDLRAFGFEPDGMLWLLDIIADDFPMMTIDPNPNYTWSRTESLSNLVDAIERRLRAEGDK
jgi:hypothetical protein